MAIRDRSKTLYEIFRQEEEEKARKQELEKLSRIVLTNPDLEDSWPLETGHGVPQKPGGSSSEDSLKDRAHAKEDNLKGPLP